MDFREIQSAVTQCSSREAVEELLKGLPGYFYQRHVHAWHEEGAKVRVHGNCTRLLRFSGGIVELRGIIPC